jgi:hypothetical protein
MISALRKIEGRGELPGATSAVMELCVDNPRQGFADLFATHPSVDSRIEALVKYAGGHDPGPLALPSDAANDARDEAADANEGVRPPPLPSARGTDPALRTIRGRTLRKRSSGPRGETTQLVHGAAINAPVSARFLGAG